MKRTDLYNYIFRLIDLPNNDTLLSLLINAVSKYTIRDKDGMIPAERDSYRNNETVIDKTTKDRKKLIGHNFIIRKENGELLTPNSMKYWTIQIKDELGINFQFHSLRKTHATMMANLNTPVIELMNRLGHKKYDTTMQFFVSLDPTGQGSIAARDSKLFYLWGHSFEFERENLGFGWEHLDKICEKLGGHDDIWYATNIEIYNYVEAYKSLSFSADSTIVSNPTVIPVWFDIDKKVYVVNPGETIKIEN